MRGIGACEYFGVIPNAQQEDEPLINNIPGSNYRPLFVAAELFLRFI